jgi:hypothetical protein
MAKYLLSVHTVDGEGREPMTEAEMRNDTRTEGSAVLRARRRRTRECLRTCAGQLRGRITDVLRDTPHTSRARSAWVATCERSSGSPSTFPQLRAHSDSL